MRLLGAQAYEGKGGGPWVQATAAGAAGPEWPDADPGRGTADAPVAPEAAMPVLLEAAKDPNPVVRADVMRVLEVGPDC